MEVFIFLIVFVLMVWGMIIMWLTHVSPADKEIIKIIKQFNEGDRYKYIDNEDKGGYWVIQIIALDKNYVLYDEYYCINKETNVPRKSRLNKITTQYKLAKYIYLSKSVKL